MATRVQFVGERPDLAAVYKLCGNAFIIGINALVADVFAVALASDVPRADVLPILDLFNPAAVISGRAKSMIAGDFSPTFELAMARKDVRLMMETAGRLPLATLPGIAAPVGDEGVHARGRDPMVRGGAPRR
jgi:3-hydroxyisobutyrate dehydrogenase